MSNAGDAGEQNEKSGERAKYEAPECKSSNPLEIMEAWEDRSSELP